MLSLNT